MPTYDDAPMLTRIAVLAYHSSPLLEPGSGDAGGMTVYVRQLAEAHERMGVYTDIFTRATGEGRAIVSLSDKVRVISVQAGPAKPLPKEELPTYLDDFAAGVRAFSTMQRVTYDVVHSHYWQSGIAGISLARALGVPLVHSQHTLGRVKNSFLAPGDAPEPSLRLEGEHRLIDEAGVLIASTEEEWEQLSCLYGALHDRIKTIHPGVDHEVFHPGDRMSARAELGIDPDDAVMLYVGRIQPLKGLELAVRAAHEVLPTLHRKLTFLVVGGASGASGRRELERTTGLVESLGLQDHVRLVGSVPHRRLPTYYRAADVLTVCSFSESFGLVALEASACGTPVIATAVGGLSYIVRDGRSGFLLGERDPAAYASRLKTLLSDGYLWREFSLSASSAASAFSWDLTASNLLELYECLARDLAPEACTC
ncbi:MAG: glycosyltransferase [Actinomycetota bacterium]